MKLKNVVVAGLLALLAFSLASCRKSSLNSRSRLHDEALTMREAMNAVAQRGSLRIHKVRKGYGGADENFELACPDLLHILRTGKNAGEDIYFGDAHYWLSGAAGRWDATRERPTDRGGTSDESCATLGAHYASLPLREPYSSYEVRDLGDFSSRGSPCHKWRLSPSMEGDPRSDWEICINPLHQMLSFEGEGLLVEFYDYAVPLAIEPPAEAKRYLVRQVGGARMRSTRMLASDSPKQRLAPNVNGKGRALSNTEDGCLDTGTCFSGRTRIP
jgi:hypothetical protein